MNNQKITIRVGPFVTFAIFIVPILTGYSAYREYFYPVFSKADSYPIIMADVFLFLLMGGLWFANKIEVLNDVITIKSIFPRRILRPIFTIKSKKKTFSINDINKIVLISTTPFGPDKKNIDELNWRDDIIIYLNQDLGITIIPLYVFPGFKKVLKDIMNKRPNIPTNFDKTTPGENINRFYI